MLVELAIRDIVLVEHLEIAYAGGLTVLTGETGAGKSILLDALTLALGGRGDASLVRANCTQGQVTALFQLPVTHPARALLAENGLADGDDLVLRRVQFADGRSRAYVNDQVVSVQFLKSLGSRLVEVHGQHDDRALVDPAMHRTLLDAFGNLEDAASELSKTWSGWRGVLAALAAERAALEQAERDAEFNRHAQSELAKLAAEEGEEALLAERRHYMMQSEKVAADLTEAQEVVSGGASPTSALAGALRRLERRAAQLPELLDPAIQALDRALVAIDEAGSAIDDALRATDFAPHELENIEERLFALRAAARKHGVSVDDLPKVAERFAAELAILDATESRVDQLVEQAAKVEALYAEQAAALSASRKMAAAALDAAVMEELPDLKLERARFTTRIDTDAGTPGPDGIDRVEFWVQTNPGTRPGPLLKVASGGELARFLLALKVVLADRGSAPTLIFDEIDTGVGGAVAEAIGRRLARLGGRVQVLAVTHAPQVAARAGHHLLISKEAVANDERVATRVEPLAEGLRLEEIARMLAGAHITDEARAAAERLLAAV